MRAVIIDDQKNARDQLRKLLAEHCRQIVIVGEAANAGDGATLILATKPELVLLDVQMPKQTGFDMLQSLGDYEFVVIFITGYDQYAIQAIRYSALDYLLKPIDVQDMVAAVSKAERKIKGTNISKQIENLLDIVSHPERQHHPIALPVAKGHRFVHATDIIFLEAMNNYTNFVMADKEKILISKGMYHFEAMLVAAGFIRCHTGYIVNPNYINKFVKGVAGHELLLKGGESIPVTYKYVSIVREALRIAK